MGIEVFAIRILSNKVRNFRYSTVTVYESEVSFLNRLTAKYFINFHYLNLYNNNNTILHSEEEPAGHNLSQSKYISSKAP
jgi:hypothetical protein